MAEDSLKRDPGPPNLSTISSKHTRCSSRSPETTGAPVRVPPVVSLLGHLHIHVLLETTFSGVVTMIAIDLPNGSD